MKRIYLGILVVIALSSSSIPGQVPQSNPAPQPRAETTLSKTVVRITGTIEGQLTFNGTGFIVSVPLPQLPGNLSVLYLVTNRHVAEAIAPDASGNPIKHRILSMEAIVNLKTPVNGTKAHEIQLPPSSDLRWRFPENSSIDLAVIPFSANETYDINQLVPGSFLTEDLWEKYRVVPGDKVMTCGYFVHYAGAHQFQPIVREGSLAMVPDDLMPVAIGGNAKVYLADLHIIPGNSGSPLFLAPAFTLGGYVGSNDGGLPYGLLGIVSGYMWEDNSLTLHPATDYEGTVHANSGIAMIVPVEQLKVLLDSRELQQERDAAVAEYKRTH